MIVTPIKTRRITQNDTDLFSFLDEYVPSIEEKSVLAITSKIISIMQGRIVKIEESNTNTQKDELIEQESSWYLPRSESPYNVSFAIAHSLLAPSAGIDESNGNGFYILWPENLQETTNEIQQYLKKRFSLNNVGVIVTDSKTTPLRWGVTGVALSHSGFQAINTYIGKKDLFGRAFEYEKVNVMDSLAGSAVYVMGEGDESCPLSVISDIPHIVFQDSIPTDEELDMIHIPLEEDLYCPFLKSASWKKGKKD